MSMAGGTGKKFGFWRIFFSLLGILVVGFLLIQWVPYGRNHTDPPVVQEPAWDNPTTKDLVTRACYDCHSNETKWPWYTNVAPASWLVQFDVDRGRQRLNFSEWQTSNNNTRTADRLARSLQDEMPPIQYLIIHADARLTATEKQQLTNGFYATFK